MIQVENLTVRYEGNPIFQQVDFLINKTDRIGLVGKNGAGKTTLLKLLAGSLTPDEGRVTMPKDLEVGYLPQELTIQTDKTVLEEARQAFEHIKTMEAELEKLQEALATREDTSSEDYLQLVQQFNDQEEALRMAGGYDMEGELERVLKGLGFKETDLNRPMTAFSGGWQMRVALAKILLRRPGLLLLDEPTNHLDIESIRWMEQFLASYEGALVMVSHDRSFLDNVTNRTLEIRFGKIADYKAPFSQYIEQREAKKQQQEAAKKDQERKKAQMQRNIERFRAKPNKAKFAKKLMRELEQMEDIEVETDDVSRANIRFKASRREGEVVAAGENLRKAYDQEPVISGLNFEIQRGDKVAFVGKNGMGKSTLAKLITGELTSYEGVLKHGHNIDLGYFAQDQPQKLDPDKTVMEVMEASASSEMRPHIRQILGAFLFSGEAVHKKVKVLSGGEKSRLALAEMILHPVNVLVLDEPTNHLDMHSKEVLKMALMDFDGTVIVVSHDRSFMEDLTNKVFEFREDGIQVYPGDINTFLEHRQLEDFRALEEEAKPQQQQGHGNMKTEGIKDKKAKRSDKGSHDQVSQKALRKLKNEVSKYEKEIEALEAELAEQEQKLNDPHGHGLDPQDDEPYRKYEAQKAALEQAMANWEAAYEKWQKADPKANEAT